VLPKRRDMSEYEKAQAYRLRQTISDDVVIAKKLAVAFHRLGNTN